LKKVGKKFPNLEASKKCSHYVTSMEIPESMLKELGVGMSENQHVVGPEWLTASIKAKMLVPETAYRWINVPAQSVELSEDRKEDIQEAPLSPSQTPVPSIDISQLTRKKGYAFENTAQNLNHHITSVLDRLKEIYIALGDTWREYGYKKACDTLKRLNTKIEKEEDVDVIANADIRGLGDKMIAKIKEIVATGYLENLRIMENDPKVKTLIMFSHVWGAGSSTALKWYNAGYRSLEDVKNSGTLNFQQEVGVKYFDELQTRIPREEVQQLEQVVRESCVELLKDKGPEKMQLVTCGSYRRLAPTCGDIDILITHESEIVLDDFLHRLIEKLTISGFLTDHLSMPSRVREVHDDQEETWSETYMGVCQLSKVLFCISSNFLTFLLCRLICTVELTSRSTQCDSWVSLFCISLEVSTLGEVYVFTPNEKVTA
jgi:hypothetical protein